MKITHRHPTYADNRERQERLLDLKRACLAKLAGPKPSGKSA